MIPGPPPVTTARPRRANSAAVRRAASYHSSPGPVLAEPKIETAGRSIAATASNPVANSSRIRSRSPARS
jgi:hypothetical protein